MLLGFARGFLQRLHPTKRLCTGLSCGVEVDSCEDVPAVDVEGYSPAARPTTFANEFGKMENWGFTVDEAYPGHELGAV